MRKKNLWIIVTVCIIVIGTSYLLARGKTSDATQNIAEGQQIEVVSNPTEPIPTPTVEPTPTPVGKKSTSNKIPPYTEVVKQYEGRRIQIDTNCQAHPTYSTYKVGTTLMFDNRTPATKKLVIDSKTYNIAGYNYILLPFKTAKEIVFDCDSLQNVATILIQK